MGSLPPWLRENLAFKALSVALAILAWFLAQGEQRYRATVVAPVEYAMPQQLVLLNREPPPGQVVIQATGNRAALRRLQQKLRDVSVRYEVDLLQARPGRTVHSFRGPPPGIPDDVTIETVSPSEIELHFDEVGTRSVPVSLRTRGSLPHGFVETSRSTNPPEIELSGARGELADLEFVQTVALRLSERRESFRGELDLDTSALHLTEKSPRRVIVELEIEEARAAREFGGLAIGLGEGMEGLAVDPPHCAVRLEGPVPVLDELARGGLRVVLDGDGKALIFQAGGHAVLAWSESPGGAGAAPALRVVVEHPRKDELTLRGTDPAEFRVRRAPPAPPGGPPQTGAAASPPATNGTAAGAAPDGGG